MWIMFSLLATASAVEPTIEVTESGGLRARVSVAVPPEQLISKLADPGWVAKVDGGTTSVTIVEKDGACTVVDYVSPSSLLTVEYRVRFCPTATGSEGVLVSSNAFSSYHTVWTVKPEGDGSLVVYDFEMDTNLLLPQSFIRGATRKPMLKLMEKIQAWGEAQRTAASATPAPAPAAP